MRYGRVAIILAALAAPLAAQTVEIYSEFQRIDPFGVLLPADRGARPREILSPAVARNAWASYHVVVSAPPETTYLLYVAMNPANACGLHMFREHFVKTRGGWVPDRLTELAQLPDFGFIADPDDAIDGQTTRVYLLDLWIPPDSGVGRFRFEVQLKVATWVIRPMEVRVVAARIPDLRQTEDAVELPPVDAGADASAMAPLLGYLDGKVARSYTKPATVRGIIRRNAIQDMALAAALDAQVAGPDALRRQWEDFVWSGARFLPRVAGAEWYLRVRDALYRAGSE
jgi:hypothetical protein